MSSEDKRDPWLTWPEAPTPKEAAEQAHVHNLLREAWTRPKAIEDRQYEIASYAAGLMHDAALVTGVAGAEDIACVDDAIDKAIEDYEAAGNLDARFAQPDARAALHAAVKDCPSSRFLRQRAAQIKGGSGSSD
jgi:hypothetical protein